MGKKIRKFYSRKPENQASSTLVSVKSSSHKKIVLVIILEIIAVLVIMVMLFFFLTREQEEVPEDTNSNIQEGEKNIVTVYKRLIEDSGGYYSYSFHPSSYLDKFVATFDCGTAECIARSAYDQYVLLEIDGSLAIYDYKNREWLLRDFQEENYQLMSYLSSFYGIYYEKDGKSYIYSVKANKTYDNLGGICLINDETFSFPSFYESGYLPFWNNEYTELVSIETGKVALKMKGHVASILIDESDNYYFGVKEKLTDDKQLVYDESGNVLFNGNSVDNYGGYNRRYVAVENNIFYIYDENKKVIYTSKKYDDILLILAEFIVVVDGNELQLVNYNGKVVYTYTDDFSYTTQGVIINQSYIYPKKGNRIIYLLVKDSRITHAEVLQDNPDLTEEDLEDEFGYGYYYLYNPSTTDSSKKAIYLGKKRSELFNDNSILIVLEKLSFDINHLKK